MFFMRFFFSLLVFFWTANGVFAQLDFFWSFKGLNNGAVNSDAIQTFATGESATLYLYWAGGDLDTGAGLDLELTNNAVIDFTGAQTFEFPIAVAGTPVDQRWQFAGDAQEVQPDSVVGLNAFTVSDGTGILEANNGSGPFLDEGYDSGAEAFLFASVDFNVTGSGGFTDILTTVGSIGVVNNGQALSPSFGAATIFVVPEPTAVSLLPLAMLALALRRMRR